MITLLIVSLVVYLIRLVKRKRQKQAAESVNMDIRVSPIEPGQAS